MKVLVVENEVVGIWRDSDPDARGVWLPNDTHITTTDEKGKPVPSGGVMRLAGPKYQANDWPERAAMRWDSSLNQWASTGAAPQRNPVEAAVAFLLNNEPPDKPKEEETAQFLQAIRIVVLDQQNE